MRRWAAALLFLGSSAAALPAGKWIDLTHPFDERTIYWPTEKGFELERVHHGTTDKGYFYSANRFAAAEHGGTHVDAPLHFYRGRNAVDEIPLERLTGPAAVVDVTRRCQADRDYQVQVSDFLEWEKRHGELPKGAIVLLRTGFGAHWPDRKKYLGTEARGLAAAGRLHFPGLHPKAAQWLATRRSVSAVGLDTASVDHGPSSSFESHIALSQANIPVLENVAHLDRLPPTGATLIALPMKIRGGSGAPARVVAVLP